MMLMITLQFVRTLTRSMRMMTAHCVGCEMIKTGPLVLGEPEQETYNYNILE